MSHKLQLELCGNRAGGLLMTTLTMQNAQIGLSLFGATLTPEGYIRRADGKLTGVKIVAKRGRYRFEGVNVTFATSPATAEGVQKFCLSFWYWQPAPAVVALNVSLAESKSPGACGCAQFQAVGYCEASR